MRTFAITLAATALLLTVTGPALAGCGSAQIAQVGAISGDPEKDTFGLLCGTADVKRTSSIASMPRGEVLQIGMSTGEAEKDSVGFVQTASAQ